MWHLPISSYTRGCIYTGPHVYTYTVSLCHPGNLELRDLLPQPAKSCGYSVCDCVVSLETLHVILYVCVCVGGGSANNLLPT